MSITLAAPEAEVRAALRHLHEAVEKSAFNRPTRNGPGALSPAEREALKQARTVLGIPALCPTCGQERKGEA